MAKGAEPMKTGLTGSLTRWAMALVLGAGMAGAQETDTPLGAGDEVQLSVLNRADLSGVFRIRGDGALSLHILGAVQAGGLTPAALEQTLEDRLSAQTDLPASVTVEVVAWRPFYVSGDIAQPGARDWRYGLTVGRALALAGGLFPAIGTTEVSSLDLRLADESSRIGTRRGVLADLHARRIRLEAEAQGLDRLTADPILTELAGARADDLLAAQQAILDFGAQSDATRIASAQERVALAEAETKSLVAQQDILREQIAQSETALRDIESLRERGLTNMDRLMQVRRIHNDEKLELMLAASYEARARQSKVNAEASIDELLSTGQQGTAIELAELHREIRAEQDALAASQSMLRRFAPYADSDIGDGALLPPAYRIRRMKPEGEVIMPAQEDTPLLPGDLLEVRRGGWPETPGQ